VELQQRSARIQNLEAQLIAARRSPAELAALVDRVEANVRTNVAKLRESLADEADRREVFQAMFPEGLTFEPTRTPDGSRQIWKISGNEQQVRLCDGQVARVSRRLSAALRRRLGR
jgi:hypothetical protein